MTKKTVSVFLSGQPRSFEEGFEYINRNLLSRDDIECKVFIHTWWYKFIDYQKIIELYNPEKILIEKELEEYKYKWYEDIVAKHHPTPYGYSALVSVNHPAKFTVSSFYSIAAASELSEYGTHYAIRLRFDYALNDKIDFEKVVPGKIYVPNCRLVPERNFCNDQMAYGTYEAVQKYCQTYYNMGDFYQKDGVMVCGEDMLAANLRLYGLVGENMVYIDPKNPFPPGNYNGTWHSLLRQDMDLWKPNDRK